MATDKTLAKSTKSLTIIGQAFQHAEPFAKVLQVRWLSCFSIGRAQATQHASTLSICTPLTTMPYLQYAAEKCIQIHFVAIAQNTPEDTAHSEANLATFAAELSEFESASASYCPCGERVDQCHRPAYSLMLCRRPGS